MRKIQRGDRVKIMRGFGRGTVGVVHSVLNDTRVTVEGAPKIVRHFGPSAKRTEGAIDRIDRPVHISNVMIVETIDGKERPVRVQFKIADGKKIRCSAKTQNQIGGVWKR